MIDGTTGLWIVGAAAAVVLLPIACYVVARAISLAHYRSKLEYDVERKRLGVPNER